MDGMSGGELCLHMQVGVSDDELEARYRLHIQEEDLLFEKRTRGLTNETQHPWSLEWLLPEEMAEAEVRACAHKCSGFVLSLRNLPIAGSRQEASGTHQEGRGQPFGSSLGQRPPSE